jgi:hypothetical protein
MEARALGIWVIAAVALLAANFAWADVAVKKIVFQGRGTARPEIQLVVTGSRGDGYSAQLWNGDYLWSSCRQAARGKGRLSFECGRQQVKMDWRGQEYRDEGIIRALLTDGSGKQEELEPLTASL